MPTHLTATEFARLDLADWRFLLGSIEASFAFGSFERAAEFVGEVARAAPDDARPRIDLRPPDTVHVALGADEARTVTEAEADLAATISRLAGSRTASSRPTALTRVEVAIDVMDMDAVRPFWQAVLGYEPDEPGPDGTIDAVVDPRNVGPAFWFQQMDEPRTQRNRIHIDVTVPPDIAEERIAAALAAGGRMVSDRMARAFWVLADPEGNEACICTWQDRDRS